MKWSLGALGAVLIFVMGVLIVGGRETPMRMETFTLTSSSFAENESIPELFTCDGANISPELHIAGVPTDAVSLVLLVDDPDIPQVFKEQRGIDDFDHWALFNIPVNTVVIPQGGTAGLAGVNGRGEFEYTGPCPPPDLKPSKHRYIFTLYALDIELALSAGATHDEIRDAMEGHILAEATLIGVYDRSKQE